MKRYVCAAIWGGANTAPTFIFGHLAHEHGGDAFDFNRPFWTGSSVEECIMKASVCGEDIKEEDIAFQC